MQEGDTQTMVSQVGVVNDTSGTKPLNLSRQGSFYSLTLDEVKNQLGGLSKPLGNLNIDELLRTVEANDSNVGPSLIRQSSISLSRGLRERTVEEVWAEIQQRGKGCNVGEMKLDDFLVHAGVVIDAVDPNVRHDGPWTTYELVPQQQHNELMTVLTSPLRGTLSDPQTVGRKRGAPGDVVQKTVERRQKRMINNRESAARSRARKQAYTYELENKISLLEEENERLRTTKEVEKESPIVALPQPKYQLHRTNSAPI